MNGEPTPFPESLCHRCAHLRRVVSGKGSMFLRCAAPELDEKYPRQPVRACPAFTATSEAASAPVKV